MKKVMYCAFFSLMYCCIYAQPALNKIAGNAFIITRMADKVHVQPKPVNDSFSAHVFNAELQQLDEDKIFFTAEDITSLRPYRFTLDEEVLQRKANFLQLVAVRYEARLQQADTMITSICKQPFNFSLNEQYTIAEDTAYPANAAAMRTKLSKLMKAAALVALLEQKDFIALTNTQQQKYADSIEPVLRHRVQAVFHKL